MIQIESPLLAVAAGDWLYSNDLAFAVFYGFPVSPGHVLVTTRRIVETWFDVTDEQRSALMALVKEAMPSIYQISSRIVDHVPLLDCC